MRRVAIALGSLPVLVGLALGAQTAVADWPQYLGTQRDGVYRGPALADTWGSSGPKVVWTKSVGQGFSGPVVAEGRLALNTARDQLTAALGVLTSTVTATVDLVGVIGAQVLQHLMPQRRARSNPRVVKRAISVYAANTARGRLRGPSRTTTTTH